MSSDCGKIISVETEEKDDGEGGTKTITKFTLERRSGTTEFEHPAEMSDQMRDLLQKGFDNEKLSVTVEYDEETVKVDGEEKVRYKVKSVKLSRKDCE
ncbi:MAG: hypothetical protein QNJ15_01745 [Erythrobacter sp.]|nr:hypothetical protein [Erythrobacter sp.]